MYRVLGACSLDRGIYEGIEADRRPMVTVQAFVTVVLSSLAPKTVKELEAVVGSGR